MKRVLVLFVVLGALSVAVSAEQITLNALFMQQAAYSEDDIRNMTADFERANPGIKVNPELVAYEALHNKIIAAAAAGGNAYDVVLFDVIWPGEFARNGILKDITDKIPKSTIDGVLPGAWMTAKYNNRYYGIPWILDTKYLFYNKAMLAKAGIAAPPKTLLELASQAKILKEKGIVRYPIVWSWAQAEAMICDYTALVNGFGGSFFDGSGRPIFQTGGSLAALSYMVNTLKQGLSNPASTESLEEDVRRVFSSGEAVFAANWTYMYALANDPAQSTVAGQVEVIPFPGDGVNNTYSGVNGSMGLGIMSGSRNPDAALKYIQFLTSVPTQEKYARLSLPIWAASYNNPAVQEGQQSLVAAAKLELPVMPVRPLLVQYQQLSAILQTQLHRALIGEASPDAVLQEAARQVNQANLR